MALSCIHCSGCLTQYVGSLDRPWASFALAVEQLQHMVRSREGIESVLRSLDGHLSEAIMQAMQNGPRLESKVSEEMILLLLFVTVYNTISPRRTELIYC